MSVIIKCDRCKKIMRPDNLIAFAEMKITYPIGAVTGTEEYHLCKDCFKEFLTNFTRTWTDEEFNYLQETDDRWNID